MTDVRQGDAIGPAPTDAQRASRLVAVVGLAPIWAAILLLVLAPGFLDPLLSNPPGILGVPFGVATLATAAVLTILGVAVMLNAGSSFVRLLAILVLTVPAVILVVLGPAIVLITRNLG